MSEFTPYRTMVSWREGGGAADRSPPPPPSRSISLNPIPSCIQLGERVGVTSRGSRGGAVEALSLSVFLSLSLSLSLSASLPLSLILSPSLSLSIFLNPQPSCIHLGERARITSRGARRSAADCHAPLQRRGEEGGMLHSPTHSLTPLTCTNSLPAHSLTHSPTRSPHTHLLTYERGTPVP